MSPAFPCIDLIMDGDSTMARFLTCHGLLRRLLFGVAVLAPLLAALLPVWGLKACRGPVRLAQDKTRVLPGIMLWAWERPEDLRFIDSKAVGVAFLSWTCRLKGGEVLRRPRLSPLQVPPGAILEAVVRIECDAYQPPALSAHQMQELIEIIGRAARIDGVRALQIDFDARRSQRAFYKELLQKLRGVLPEQLVLSITALSSWCMYDSWVSGLPVDEIVPMVFRMGIDHDRIHSDLRKHGGFIAPRCGRSIGISTDERIPAGVSGRRLYVFHPARWSQTAFLSILKRVKSNEDNR